MVHKKNTKSIFLVPSCLLVCGLLIAASGCSSIPTTTSNELPTQTAESAGMYQVVMQGQFGKPAQFQGQIDGPLTVQSALERSGAIEKFRGMDITLMRVVEESGRGLKLPVEFEAGKKTVRSDQDYAIHPNDRIMVQARSKNPIDKIVDTLVRQ